MCVNYFNTIKLVLDHSTLKERNSYRSVGFNFCIILLVLGVKLCGPFFSTSAICTSADDVLSSYVGVITIAQQCYRVRKLSIYFLIPSLFFFGFFL